MYKRELRGLLIFIILLIIIASTTICISRCGKSSPAQVCMELKPDTTSVSAERSANFSRSKKSKKDNSKKSKDKKPKQPKSRRLTSPFDDPTPSLE